MNGSVNYAGFTQITRCSICGNRVPLETSKTDERGSAVHEECYVGRTVALLAQQQSERLAQITLLCYRNNSVQCSSLSIDTGSAVASN